MKAVQILRDVSSPKIAINYSMAKPEPLKSEILVRVHAAGVTGDEIMWSELYKTPSRIPGHEISGTIAAFGPEYSGSLKIGQEVFAFLAAGRGEGQAVYAVCSDAEIAPKPASLSYTEAAVLPIPLLTALEAMDYGNTTSDSKVLLTGASGAVGQQFLQLVKQKAGAHVIALASTRNHDMLLQLGANEVIDYAVPDWQKGIHDVDFVFDTVGGDVLTKTWETVKSDGTIVTVGDPAPAWAFGREKAAESLTYPDVRYNYFIVSPNEKRLREVAQMFDEGVMKPLAVKTYPFDQAVEAWEHARQRGRAYKVVIEF
ncbi:Reticulon-4-interacting protein 1 like protein, mitochondrial [Fusarium austroafricanum]|uniref:Reticulon-4-interacting protein 1 like protein, mitochondrial n=1 Tax=Fusarium austroafricanum TaxID=2364996 RepID=A0A8H4KPH2_9HYPO|nr:Reticulon-4-interacting protein 1 like protein, mitochondrial [Fusarium austroafricanum]